MNGELLDLSPTPVMDIPCQLINHLRSALARWAHFRMRVRRKGMRSISMATHRLKQGDSQLFT